MAVLSDAKLVEVALLICADGRDHPWSGPPCQSPCAWCLNEARLELQADIATRSEDDGCGSAS